jgi:cellulose biosynthesis protein BcsQ
VSEGIVRAADLILAPLVPAPLSVRTLDQLRSFIAEAKGPAPDLLAFLSMVDRRRRLHRDLSEQLPKENQDVADTVIPMASVVEQMGVRRSPVVAWARTSPASVAYRSLWDEARLRAKL